MLALRERQRANEYSPAALEAADALAVSENGSGYLDTNLEKQCYARTGSVRFAVSRRRVTRDVRTSRRSTASVM